MNDDDDLKSKRLMILFKIEIQYIEARRSKI
jgi:hypothetical protein